MQSERDKMLAGELYDANHPDLVASRERARGLTLQLNSLPGGDTPDKRRLLRALFGAGGDSVLLTPPFQCEHGNHIELGERVYFNFNCVILDVCRVRIGSFTLLGPGVQIYTALHPMDAMQRRTHEFCKPVNIGQDVWLGGGVLVLPGVTIGDRCVIGAGSVVTRDVPADTFAAGNPCRAIRRLNE